MRLRRAVVWLLLICFCIHQSCGQPKPQRKWEDVDGLLSGTIADFHSLVDPLVQMITVTYETTKGSKCWYGGDLNPPAGFKKKDGLSVDVEIGMRALVFVDDHDSGPVVVSFRGSGFPEPTNTSLADICFIASYNSPDNILKNCTQYEPEQIDYYSQANEVVKKVINKYKGRKVILTGHEMGCALTGMMAVKYSKEVTGVCFSLPGILDYTMSRTSYSKIDILDMKNFFVLAESEDPITVSAYLRDQFFGQPFLWISEVLSSCYRCCMDLGINVDDVSRAFVEFSCTVCYENRNNFCKFSAEVALDPARKATREYGVMPLQDCGVARSLTVDGRIGRLGMIILLILVIITAIGGVTGALIAFGQQKNPPVRYVELERPGH